mmetsp:Transcript_28778/g.31969  ORF Transcript_28778/g.31969 Transcript_28778/m.31969 type:complete len:111 (+) Transcript_28778:1-333(+)
MVESGTTKKINFGLYAPVAVRGVVWSDENANGALDGPERGIPHIEVQLLQRVQDDLSRDVFRVVTIDTQMSDGKGYFSFEDLRPGQYSVDFEKTDQSVTTDPRILFKVVK